MRYYPLELDLRDQPVLMVGAGKVAGRKLPELLACGARVTVVAPKASPVVKRLLPGLEWRERAFLAEDAKGKRLVFACTGDPAANASVSDVCRALGIPCNRADAAAQGDFIVPGVVRRGPVTVSISTEGRAPALTKHLKAKLATTLGEEWGVLAELIAEARDTKRDFDGLDFDAMAKAVHKFGKESARSFLEAKPAPAVGEVQIHPVLLVGAGPGPAELLTSAALAAICEGEVVIHDRLVDAGVLALIPDSCQKIPAEKRGHFESRRQDHINSQLIAEARAGKRVVRLKGGDPFVFGRGFEEALALQAAGIPWRVIPGLSSATAVPALAGIPLTHRGVARSFAVASGMAGGETNPEFPKADTLVLLMALYRLEEIIPALEKAGYAPSTPAAVIQSGGLPEQRVCRSTLEKLRADAARQGFDSPALIVVGKVVGLARTR